IEFFVTQRPLSPHFSVIPVGKIFFSVFSILWESRNNEHRNYLNNKIYSFILYRYPMRNLHNNKIPRFNRNAGTDIIHISSFDWLQA
ncbi:hypothetical protein, partial [Macrococcoides caseolyticum]|uniref:hypothetical protein n=1 Tax=Macrococcoides caseolyticum TaxID=69966 RepID=UPI001E33A993